MSENATNPDVLPTWRCRCITSRVRLVAFSSHGMNLYQVECTGCGRIGPSSPDVGVAAICWATDTPEELRVYERIDADLART